MGFLGRLFGTDAAIKEGMGMIRDVGDSLFYTDEERAEDGKADRSEGRKMLIEWVKASQGQNLSRRIIALSVTGTWLSQIVIAQILSVASIWSDNPESLIKAVDILNNGADKMDGPVMLVMGFYYAAPHMAKFVNAWAEGRKGRGNG